MPDVTPFWINAESESLEVSDAGYDLAYGSMAEDLAKGQTTHIISHHARTLISDGMPQAMFEKIVDEHTTQWWKPGTARSTIWVRTNVLT
jgi:hypothetical protein